MEYSAGQNRLSRLGQIGHSADEVEFGAYRPLTGSHQVVIYYQFTDLAAWAAWRESDEVEKVFNELYEGGSEVELELWEPSPAVPQPLRPPQRG